MYSLSFCTNRIGSHKNRNIFWKTSSFSDFFFGVRAAALSVHNLSFIPICVPPCGERGDLRGVQDGLRPSPRTFRRPEAALCGRV